MTLNNFNKAENGILHMRWSEFEKEGVAKLSHELKNGIAVPVNDQIAMQNSLH